MYLADGCPACGQGPLEPHWALTAPFIAEYVLDEGPRPCRLMQCEGCGIRFFEDRFDEREIARLYSDYRGLSYFAARHRHEFWYSRKVNEGIGGGGALVRARNGRLAAFLGTHLDLGAIEKVLDYGGDAGQFIPEGVGRKRWVFEISQVPPIAGVVRVAEEADLAAAGYDLVLLGHVLEHCSEPKDMIFRLKALLPQNGVLYLEVPYERYGLAFARPSARYRAYLEWIAHHPRLLQLLDFYSTAARIGLGAIPPFGFTKLHEHLNFFTEGSLRTLMEGCGMSVVACAMAPLAPGASRDRILACLARPS